MALTILLASFALPAPAQPATHAERGVVSSIVSEASGSASVRIVRSYRLKRQSLHEPVEGAALRRTWLIDRDGERREIDLVEFE